MKLLNRVGGAFLLLVLGIAAITGFQSPTGRPMWDNLWAAGRTVVRYARDQAGRLGGTDIAGHGFRAIGAAAVVVLLIITVSKGPITNRQFGLLLLLGAGIALVLWNPAIVT
jgi:hypothetical protein